MTTPFQASERSRAAVIHLCLLLVAGVGISCSSTSENALCGPSTCQGCCDGAGVCQSGTLPSACGASGTTCSACGAGQACEAGVCAGGGSEGGGDQGALLEPTSSGCLPGLTRCGAACVSLKADAAHCGSCGRACGAQEICDNGNCVADTCAGASSCPVGYYCNTVEKRCRVGCENSAACRWAPNLLCDPAAKVCKCAQGSHDCSGQCLPDASAFSCGSLCEPCPGTANGTGACSNFVCGFECNEGFHNCNGQCVSENSPATCGTRCTPCPTGPNEVGTCTSGTCGTACVAGSHRCGGVCVSNNDSATCGSSCSPCPLPIHGLTTTCNGSSCGFTCAADYVPCGSGCCRQKLVLDGGGEHACGITPSGTTKCWGHFERTGGTGLSSLSLTSISAGSDHSCGLTASGGVKCWGTSGLLGNPSGTGFSPVDVQGLPGPAVAVSAGWGHSCAVLATGDVYCWGQNTWGQLGTGDTTTAPTAVAAKGISGAVTVAAGSGYTCALTELGAVLCWGHNQFGELGDGTTTNRLSPVTVVGLSSGVTEVSAGYTHACVRTAAGAVRCWGRNEMGEVGDGTLTRRTSPVTVSGLGSGAVAIATGSYHSCAVTQAGAVRCWGSNYRGQLGNGTGADALTPVGVSGLSTGATDVLAGGQFSCALVGAQLKCWGENNEGQLADGSSTDRATPVDAAWP